MTRREDLLTIDEAATYLNVDMAWLGRARPGRPKRVKLGRRVLFLRADLDAFIEQQRSEVTPCRSIGVKIAISGGAGSKSAGAKSGSRLAKSIGARLRGLNAS